MQKSIKIGKPLDPSQLQRNFTLPETFFEKPVSKDHAAKLLGQKRAIDAIELSAEISHSDFNLFVLGPQGYGKHEAVLTALQKHASKKTIPSDWVYVNNFENSNKPIAIELPPGKANRFKNAMEELVDDLANEIPALFEGEDYQSKRRTMEQEFSEENEKSFADFINDSQAKELAVLRTPMGFGIIAMKDGKTINSEEFESLPEKEQKRIDGLIAKQQKALEKILKQIPKREKEHRREVEALNASIAEQGIDEAIGETLKNFGKIKAVAEYLSLVRSDLIENIELFLELGPAKNVGSFPIATSKYYLAPQFRRYAVNVMVSHTNGGKRGAPVVTQELPSLANLVGRTEYISEMGALLTDFTMIRPGDLHKANHGYLVLDARQILIEPFAWETLKRCLKTGQISITSTAERFSLNTTKALEPDPIPLNVRVVLVGDRLLYYMLMALDPEFAGLFKIAADFDNHMPISKNAIKQYAEIVSGITVRKKLRAITSSGVERVLLESTRLSDDQEKFSLNLGKLSDILEEANYWASKSHKKEITSHEIERAISEADRRADRIPNHRKDAIKRNVLLIDTRGKQVGQINALSVLQIGGSRFGSPSRITASVRMGKGKVLDIEREVELGGPLHSKGVLILMGYLSANYSLKVPLSLSATLVFEQSYGGVDGDSASAAELFALLSAISELPLDQSYAVTGSVNQKGQIQAIGGVNEKIEGFFDVCMEKGLTGKQGVLIPVANVKNLVLRQRVVDAVKNRKFSIIPIETIDQGIEFLTQTKAGKRNREGKFPKNTVNGLVEAKLYQYAKDAKAYTTKSESSRLRGAQ